MNIFFDLDGTLIDSKNRLFSLFSDLTLKNVLSFDEYWNLKRSMFSNEWILERILGFARCDVESFSKKWMELVESDKYLSFDNCFYYTPEVLEELKKKGILLYIITSRNNKKAALKQIDRFGISRFFSKIFITGDQFSKSGLIKNSGVLLSPYDIIAGDTELDISEGKSLNIRTIGVLSGFRNYESLLLFKPDYIFNDISQIIDIIA